LCGNGFGDTLSRTSSRRERVMPLDIKTDKRKDASILHCAGRLVFGEETEALRSHVKEVIAENPRVILEMSGVKDVDSGGVGTLVALFTSTRSAGGDLKLVAPGSKVRQTLTITRLLGVFHVYDSVEDAMASFAPSTVSPKSTR
jgi:anti-sigma B factor antagonist